MPSIATIASPPTVIRWFCQTTLWCPARSPAFAAGPPFATESTIAPRAAG